MLHSMKYATKGLIMVNLLLVEDDPNLGKGLKANLELENYHVYWAQTIYEAHILCETNNPDLILLDLGLPDGNGFEFCLKIRQAKKTLPIIILTADSNEDSVVRGFSSGANDYVKKPFSSKELFARIKAQLSINLLKEKELSLGKLHLFIESRKVVFDKTDIELNRKEFELLHFLIQRKGAIATREDIISKLGQSEEISDRTIDSHISHLRTKLKKGNITSITIKSEYGLGYRLVTHV